MSIFIAAAIYLLGGAFFALLLDLYASKEKVLNGTYKPFETDAAEISPIIIFWPIVSGVFLFFIVGAALFKIISVPLLIFAKMVIRIVFKVEDYYKEKTNK